MHVAPKNGIYQMTFVFDDGKDTPVCSESERIIAVDPGVDNLMAVINNCGLPCILFNGKPLKAINQLYNKQIANIMSENTIGTTDRFVPTPHYQRVTLKRNNCVKDYLLKSARILIDWCVENRIDTIVLGKNVGWKQESQISHLYRYHMHNCITSFLILRKEKESMLWNRKNRIPPKYHF